MAPIYEYLCSECGIRFEELGKMAESGDPKACRCGKQAKRVISTGGLPPWKPYYDPMQSQNFDTRESHTAYCRKHGLEGVTAGEFKHAQQEARHMKDEHDHGRISKEHMV